MKMPKTDKRMTQKRKTSGERRSVLHLPDNKWKKKLTPEQFHVLRKKGTEIPFTGRLLYNKDKGVYMCAGCGNPVFASGKKFDSGTGWPSFWEPIKGAVKTKTDRDFLMTWTEVLCKKCGGHLGHVFDDAPQTPTGLRYCINSCALGFEKSRGKPKAKYAL